MITFDVNFEEFQNYNIGNENRKTLYEKVHEKITGRKEKEELLVLYNTLIQNH